MSSTYTNTHTTTMLLLQKDSQPSHHFFTSKTIANYEYISLCHPYKSLSTHQSTSQPWHPPVASTICAGWLSVPQRSCLQARDIREPGRWP